MLSGVSFYNALDSYNKAKFSLDIQKQKVANDVKSQSNYFRTFVTNLYDQMENCTYSECANLQFSYEWRSSQLKAYYQLAGCEQHSKRLSDIDRYMQARFYIASNLAVAKKKQLPQVQKDYYNVITEEINELYHKRCVMN
jgi:hypothetical protein